MKKFALISCLLFSLLLSAAPLYAQQNALYSEYCLLQNSLSSGISAVQIPLLAEKNDEISALEKQYVAKRTELQTILVCGLRNNPVPKQYIDKCTNELSKIQAAYSQKLYEYIIEARTLQSQRL